jgi:hypothetical protein
MPKPVTWVRLTDGTHFIWRSTVETDKQHRFCDEFAVTSIVQSTDEPGLDKIRDEFLITDRVITAPSVVARLTMSIAMWESAREFFCWQQFKGITQTAILFVSLVHRNGGQIIGETAEKDMRTALKLTGSEDVTMVVKIAALYDKNRMAKLPLMRQ